MGRRPPPLRPGLPLLQRRLLRQPVPRLHGRAGAAVHQHAPVPGPGAVPAERDEAVVGGQVHALLPAADPVRRHRRGQRPGGALLPPDRGRRHLPQGHGRGPAAVAGPRLRGGLQARAAPRLRPSARGRLPRRRHGARQAPAADHLAPRLPAVPERAGDGARRGGRRVRGARGGARPAHGHGRVRGAGELGGRDGGRARRRADQHGVPAPRRRARPGCAVRRAGVAHGRHFQGPRRGHGGELHGLRRDAGGELADRPVPEEPPGAHGPLRRAQAGLGRAQGGVPG
uniref:Uncharacterized protein n=1 Tax=Zea mays TaxID=4577 RepID=C4JAU0_MAIZE|nr:unknown [Zea mays]